VSAHVGASCILWAYESGIGDEGSLPGMKSTTKNNKHTMDDSRTAAFFLLLCFVFCVSCTRPAAYPDAPIQGKEVVIDATALAPDMPTFFTYRNNGAAINFFVVKNGDEVFAFLDACRSCKPRLGYTSRDGFIICKVCGTRYSIAALKNGIGGCYPIRISGKNKNGKYSISISELQKPL
jgi:uncharacterized membrane protein